MTTGYDINRARKRIDAISRGFDAKATPGFEDVMYASNSNGLKYFYGHFKSDDVLNSSPKFQEMLKNYQSLSLNTHTRYIGGPSAKMYHGLKKLLKQAKKENVKFYSNEEYRKTLADFQKKEDERLDEWLKTHPNLEKDEELDKKKSKMTADDSNVKIDEVYDKIMEEAGLDK